VRRVQDALRLLLPHRGAIEDPAALLSGPVVDDDKGKKPQGTGEEEEGDDRVEVIKEGWCSRQSTGLVKTWKKVYVCLDQVCLYLCKDPCSAPEQVLPVHLCQFQFNSGSSENSFEVFGPDNQTICLKVNPKSQTLNPKQPDDMPQGKPEIPNPKP
jgi:hypothetical protein